MPRSRRARCSIPISPKPPPSFWLRELFDVERTESDLGVRFATDFDRRPGSKRE
jgi:hypothetical protein